MDHRGRGDAAGVNIPSRDDTMDLDPDERPRASARSSFSNSRQHSPYPSPQRPDMGLYTIQSQVAVPSAQRAQNDATLPSPGASLSPPVEADVDPLDPERGRRRSAISFVDQPISVARPRHFAKAKDSAANLAATNETLAHYRDWIRRQRERQRRWTSGPYGRFKARTWSIYRKVIIEGLLRQKPLPPSADGRHVPIEPGRARRKPLTDERSGKAHISNFIRSTRYDVWNFLPKQLIFQFSKLANFYFLVIGVMQMIPGFSTTGSYTTIAPLIAFVSLSMAKEGWDDYRRYRLDKGENRSMVIVLDPDRTISKKTSGSTMSGFWRRKPGKKDAELGMSDLRRSRGGTDLESEEDTDKWSRIQWQHLRVGDIIKLHRDEMVPADIVLLHASGPNGSVHIETMALDGETNLKSKQAPTILAERCGSLATMQGMNAEIVSEDPNLDLYSYDGRAVVDGKAVPLTMSQVVYRGSTVRNTDRTIGMVINSGEECKIRMNAHKSAKAKAPAMQGVVNRIVILLVIFVILLAAGCTVGNQVWIQQYQNKAWQLRNAGVPIGHILSAFIIMFNTLIPLSLYVSLEIVKIGQLILMQDVEMYDPETDTPLVANTSTILEDLGQISYVFSDKTGTLTENKMRFRKMSVAGTAWLHDMDIVREAEERERKAQRGRSQKASRKHRKANRSKTPQPPVRPSVSRGKSTEVPLILEPADPSGHRLSVAGSVSQWTSTVRPAHAQPELKTDDLIQYLRSKPHSTFSRKARHFILCMALCHTCLPETKDNGEIEFQAASPDELALVQAARDLGYLLIDRPSQCITLEFHDMDGNPITEKYEVLDVIEFSSKRKRMSIVIRMPDGRVCVFTKGADSTILPRLRLNQLAIQKASAVERRASKRKSMEQEKAMARRSSVVTPRTSLNLARTSLSLQGGTGRRRSSAARRSASVNRQSAVQSVDEWLTRREREELEEHAGNDDAYAVPRPLVAQRKNRDMLAAASSSGLSPLEGLVDEGLAGNDGAIFDRCFQHIDDFASEGLRTLLFAYRYIDEDDYRKWKVIYHEASTSITNRQERIEAAAELIEQNLDLAGATAIEDKLQKGVPDTIDKLRRANIKVWMLTGDKRETAINIAHSARICKPFSEVYILDAAADGEASLHERIASTLVEVGRGMIPHSVVVIDGHTLSIVEGEGNEEMKILFLDLVARVDSVICCRASPSQKAGLVEHIRRQVPHSMTLAIGDGANDIAMIQASHVGIGISGREGLQAARISDYSIAQFRFLQRLLFVHGRWNYIRTGKYILATFWKEVVFYLIQAVYQRYNGYTGTSLYESVSLTVFNTLFTSLPVILLGIFEKDLRADTLLAFPELYTFGQRKGGFNFKLFFGWTLMGATEAVLIFYLLWAVYSEALSTNDTSLFAMGALAFTIAVVFINIKCFVLELHNQTIISFLGLFISISGWFVWNLFLGAIASDRHSAYLVRNTFRNNFGRNPIWWLTGLAALAAVIVLELAVSGIRRVYFPTDQDLMQEVEKNKDLRSVVRGHAGAAEEGEAGLSDGRMGGEEDGEDDKTRASSSTDLERFSFGGDARRRSSDAGSLPVGGSKRASRLVPEEYIPPPFTPPIEDRERDDPFAAAFAGSSGKKGGV